MRSDPESAVVLAGDCRIPHSARSLFGFRRWLRSDAFPVVGRIDYLAGDLEVDMSPEDLFTHGAVKSAVASALHRVVVGPRRGEVFIDRARVTAPAVGLSAEPDVVVLLWGSVESGRVRLVPAAGGAPGRYVEIEGGPDLVVEVVSESSEAKDFGRLPALYAAAGVRELWLIDARLEPLRFRLIDFETAKEPAPDRAGRRISPVLGRLVRLSRQRGPFASWRYKLTSGPRR